MAVRKIAISVPEDVLGQVDRLARKTGVTRSGLITRVLREVGRAQTSKEITEKIDHLFEDRSVADEQLDTSRAFLRAAEKNHEDSEW